MQVPIGCTMCVGEIEHLRHLFCECSFAQECWRRVGLVYNMRDVESAPDWLLDRMSNENEENLIKIAAVLWGGVVCQK